MKRIVGIVMVLGSVGACASEGSDSNPISTNITSNPIANPNPKPSAKGIPTPSPSASKQGPVAAPRYQLTTTIAIPPTVLLPQPAFEVLTLLEDLRTSPSSTLLDLAGGSLTDALRSALPSVLEDKLVGWMDAYLKSALFEGTTVGAALDSLHVAAQTALTHFDVVSELSMPADGGPGRHRLRALRFDIAGTESVVEIPSALSGTPLVSQAPMVATSKSTLSIGDHSFGIPVGDYLYAGLDAAAMQRYGMNFRASLPYIVSCQALAEDVADHCVWSVCVGHASLLEDICEAGLDKVVSTLKDKLSAYDVEVLRFASGKAMMSDSAFPSDGVLDLVEGDFACELDLSTGARPVAATFKGISIE